jgi:hypothetical protein
MANQYAKATTCLLEKSRLTQRIVDPASLHTWHQALRHSTECGYDFGWKETVVAVEPPGWSLHIPAPTLESLHCRTDVVVSGRRREHDAGRGVTPWTKNRLWQTERWRARYRNHPGPTRKKNGESAFISQGPKYRCTLLQPRWTEFPASRPSGYQCSQAQVCPLLPGLDSVEAMYVLLSSPRFSTPLPSALKSHLNNLPDRSSTASRGTP